MSDHNGYCGACQGTFSGVVHPHHCPCGNGQPVHYHWGCADCQRDRAEAAEARVTALAQREAELREPLQQAASPSTPPPPNRRTDPAGTTLGHGHGHLRVLPDEAFRRLTEPLTPSPDACAPGAEGELSRAVDLLLGRAEQALEILEDDPRPSTFLTRGGLRSTISYVREVLREAQPPQRPGAQPEAKER